MLILLSTNLHNAFFKQDIISFAKHCNGTSYIVANLITLSGIQNEYWLKKEECALPLYIDAVVDNEEKLFAMNWCKKTFLKKFAYPATRVLDFDIGDIVWFKPINYCNHQNNNCHCVKDPIRIKILQIFKHKYVGQLAPEYVFKTYGRNSFNFKLNHGYAFGISLRRKKEEFPTSWPPTEADFLLENLRNSVVCQKYLYTSEDNILNA